MAKILAITCAAGFKNAQRFIGPAELEPFLAVHPEYDTLLFVIWHWKVPTELLEKYRCIGMHTGPLLEGKGKGPSPIKNLKAKDIKYATVCSFEMTANYDEGKVLTAEPVCIDGPESLIYQEIDSMLPRLVGYLAQPKSEIPEVWTRIKAIL